MKILFRILVCSACFFPGMTLTGYGQEVLTPVSSYPYDPVLSVQISGHLKVLNIDTLHLPFFEDFSRPGNLPDQKIWTDTYAYINNSYAVDPVSIGVATLDAVDADGSLNGTTRTPFLSDFLTSKPIDLNYPGRNDIIFSFFYQPQGMGSDPQKQDSLLLDFYAPQIREWFTVWSDTGKPLEAFRQVFIPVRDEKFLLKGFQFRFKNYASMPDNQGYPNRNSNRDHWNIDYIYLDTARLTDVTAINDVAMTGSLGSILKSYEAMPWKHFKRAFQTQIKPYIPIIYKNNDTTSRNVTRMLEITDRTVYKKETFSGGAINVPAGGKDTLDFPYNFPFVFYQADSVLFEIKSYLVTDELDYKWNDTVTRYQKFYNYYSYDDGSAEAGYDLQGEGTINARVACQFKSFETDTLRGVQMYFPQVVDEVGKDYFLLTVWGNDLQSNQPGEVLYSMSGARPVYSNEINKFRIYELDTVLVVKDLFYVGWIKTTENSLNVGFDRNNNNSSNIFYNLGQQWQTSSKQGSLMIRPIMGRKIVYPASATTIAEKELMVYPNPASDHIMIGQSWQLTKDQFVASIFNLEGLLVLQTREFENGIDVSALPPGIYLLSLTDSKGTRLTKKFVILR